MLIITEYKKYKIILLLSNSLCIVNNMLVKCVFLTMDSKTITIATDDDFMYCCVLKIKERII